MGLCNVLKGEGTPYTWGNQIKNYSDSVMTYSELSEVLSIATGGQPVSFAQQNEVLATRNDLILIVWKLAGSPRVA